MDLDTIHPINGNHLVRLEDRNEGRIILLGSKRSIAAAHFGTCLRSEKFQGARVLVSTGGIPLSEDPNLRFVHTEAILRVDGVLQSSYIHIEPVEVSRARIIDLIVDRFSGWYKVIETYPGCELVPGQTVVPIYGQPRLEMEDDTEYCSIEAVGVYDVGSDSDAADDQITTSTDQAVDS